MAKSELIQAGEQGENILFSDVCGIIDNARKHIAGYVNSEICLTQWYVVNCIRSAMTIHMDSKWPILYKTT